MKKIFHNNLKISFSLLFALFIAVAAFAGDKYEYSKIIKKQFDITATGTTKISNKYGKIILKTWDANRVLIEVNILVKAKSESRAKSVFDRININFSNRPDYVEAITEIESGSNSWFSFGNSESNADFKINYQIYLPVTNHIDIYNKYGNIGVDKMENMANLEVKYGNIEAEGFADKLNLIVGYGNASFLQTAEVNAEIKYGKLRINNSSDIDLYSKYSKIYIDNAKSLDCETKYDDLNLGSIDNIKLEGKYGDVSIETVSDLSCTAKYTDFTIENANGNVDLDLEYGSAAIRNLASNADYVRLYGRYTDFRLGLPVHSSYSLDVDCEYAGVRLPNSKNLKIIRERDSSNYYELEAYAGSQDATPRIKARLKYGGLKFY